MTPSGVTLRIGDEEIAGTVHSDSAGGVEPRGSCRPRVSAEASCSVARYSGDDPSWSDLPNAVISLVRNEEVAARIHGDSSREVELGSSRRAPVSTEAGYTSPCNCRQCAIGSNVVYAMVKRAYVGEIETTHAVGRDGLRLIQVLSNC
jgi:hypothetical protein